MTVTRAQTLLAVITAISIALLLLIIQGKQRQLDDLHSKIGTACSGRVAALDLTEWISICNGQ